MESHPGKALIEHGREVQEIGLTIFDYKHNHLTKQNKIRRVLEIILEKHDYGKGTAYFQEYLKNPNLYLRHHKKAYKSHSLLSAHIVYTEIFKELQNYKLAFIGFCVVKMHHSALSDMSPSILGEGREILLKKQFEMFKSDYFNLTRNERNHLYEFIKESNSIDLQDVIQEQLESLTIRDYLLVNYLFSLLIAADKGCAIYHSSHRSYETLKRHVTGNVSLEKDVVDKYKRTKFGNETTDSNIGRGAVNKKREEIYKGVEKSISDLNLDKERILSIHVPTGYGKTLTAYNAAFKLNERLENRYKMIYVLPFTSIIEQNFTILEDILGKDSQSQNVLMKHHYLAQKEYQTEESLTYDIQEYLIENWDSKIIVTTFVQFLHSLFTNQNRQLKKFHNLSNAIIILDEVQSIPYKYWKLVNQVFKELAVYLDSYILLVTATMPLIFDEDKKEILELVPEKEKYFENLNRIHLNLKYINKLGSRMDIEEFKEIIVEDMTEHPNNSFLFVMNTINSSIEIYKFLKVELGHLENTELYYLSNNIIPKERTARISAIKENLEKYRKGKYHKRIIVVSTQMVEAGVDIDLDRVYRDIAPLDCIIQTAGRCNRNGGGTLGIVIIVKLEDNKDLYAKYVYDSVLLETTLKVLENESDTVKESDFNRLAKQYFQQVKKVKSSEASDKLITQLSNLDYEDAFTGKDQFQLIKQEFKTVEVFIEVDQEAQFIYKRYQEIQQIEDVKEKKRAFDKIKSEFLSYVISIPQSIYKGVSEELFEYVSYAEAAKYYDKNTGFKRDKKCTDYFF